jgi:hypothetical protein
MAVQETRTLPAQFVEDLGTDLAKQLVAQTGCTSCINRSCWYISTTR